MITLTFNTHAPNGDPLIYQLTLYVFFHAEQFELRDKISHTFSHYIYHHQFLPNTEDRSTSLLPPFIKLKKLNLRFVHPHCHKEMGTIQVEIIPVCHVVAMPYPGRGHVNPMMNLCTLLASRKPDIIVSFVVTEEWHGFIKSEPKPDNVRFATIPNVIPSELERAKDFPGFMHAVSTKMEGPFEELLDRLDPPVTAIIADTKLVWSIDVANRKNIPVASLWPMSATIYSLLYHFDMLKEKGHFPIELKGEQVNYITQLFNAISSNLFCTQKHTFFSYSPICSFRY